MAGTVVNTDFTAPTWGSFAKQNIAFEAAHGVVQKAEIQVLTSQFGVANVANALVEINKAATASLKFSDIIQYTGIPADAAVAEAEFLRRLRETHSYKAYGLVATVAGTATTTTTDANLTLANQNILAGVIGNGGGSAWASIYAASSDFGKVPFKYAVDTNTPFAVTEDATNGREYTISNPVSSNATLIGLFVKGTLATGVSVSLQPNDLPANSFSLENAIRYVRSASAIGSVAQADVTSAVIVEAYNLANTTKSLTDANAITLSGASPNNKILKPQLLKSGKFDADIKKLATYDDIWVYIDEVVAADRFKKYDSINSNYRFYTLAVSKFINFAKFMGLDNKEIVRIISTTLTGSTTIKAAAAVADTIAVATVLAAAAVSSDTAGVAGVPAGFTVTGNTQPLASTVGVNALDANDFFNASASLNIQTAQDVCDFLSLSGLQKPTLVATTGTLGLNGNGTRWAAFKDAYQVPGNTCTTDLNVIHAGLVLLAKLTAPNNSEENNLTQINTWIPHGLSNATAVSGISFSTLSSRENGLVGIAKELAGTFSIVGDKANHNIVSLLVKLGTESGENKVSKLYPRFGATFTLSSGILGTGFTKGAAATAADKVAMYQWVKSITMDKLTLLRAYASIVYTTVDSFVKVLDLGNHPDFSLDYLMKLSSAPVALDGTTALFTAPSAVFQTVPTNVTTDEDKVNQVPAAVFEMALADVTATPGLADVVGRGLIKCIVALGSSNYEFFAFTRGVALAAAKTGMSTLESYMISVNIRESCKHGDGEVLLGAVAVALSTTIATSTSLLGLPLTEAYPKLTVSQSLLISEFASLINRILNKPLNIRFKEVRASMSLLVKTLLTSYSIDNTLAIIVLVEAMSGPDKKISKREYDELISLGINEFQIKCAVRAELDVVGTLIKSEPRFHSYLEYSNGEVVLSTAF